MPVEVYIQNSGLYMRVWLKGRRIAIFISYSLTKRDTVEEIKLKKNAR